MPVPDRPFVADVLPHKCLSTKYWKIWSYCALAGNSLLARKSLVLNRRVPRLLSGCCMWAAYKITNACRQEIESQILHWANLFTSCCTMEARLFCFGMHLSTVTVRSLAFLMAHSWKKKKKQDISATTEMLIACKDSAALAFTGTGFLVAMPAYLREAVWRGRNSPESGRLGTYRIKKFLWSTVCFSCLLKL